MIENYLPSGHKIMDTAIEGGQKTSYACGLAVDIASGHCHLGLPAQQGKVMIVDEETPTADLENWLDRFALGLGYGSYKDDLPIYVFSKLGFRFGRKELLDKLIEKVIEIQPSLIRMESLIAMLPGGRQGIVENDSGLGVTIRDDLEAILNACPKGTSLMLSAHSKKPCADFSLDDFRKANMVSLVRGHGSIVGQGCDTGIAIKQVSKYPEPTIFVVLIKPRRRAIPIKELWVELKEAEYGKGWARLEKIAPTVPKPSLLERQLYSYLHNEGRTTESKLRNAFSLHPAKAIYNAVMVGIERGIILRTPNGQYYATTCPTMGIEVIADAIEVG